MIAEYFIYRRKGDKEPFISLGEMPQYGLRPKQKFTGKKLKIEVIRRLSGVEIEQTATTPQINAYIEANIENPDLSIDDLAHEMALSRSVFFRKIKALVGYSPINFLQVIRIKRAIQLMQTRKFSMAEIAYKVGYTDPKYFSRSFKKITGKSPSVYLREK